MTQAQQQRCQQGRQARRWQGQQSTQRHAPQVGGRLGAPGPQPLRPLWSIPRAASADWGARRQKHFQVGGHASTASCWQALPRNDTSQSALHRDCCAAPLLPRRPPLPLCLLRLPAQQRLLRLQAGHQVLAISVKVTSSKMLGAVKLSLGTSCETGVAAVALKPSACRASRPLHLPPPGSLAICQRLHRHKGQGTEHNQASNVLEGLKRQRGNRRRLPPAPVQPPMRRLHIGNELSQGLPEPSS